MKNCITTIVVLWCLCLVFPGKCAATEAKSTRNEDSSPHTVKKLKKLKIAVPYNGEIDMSIVSHADKVGGKFSSILENQYRDEFEQKKESDRNFWQK